jgi:putative endonuclease
MGKAATSPFWYVYIARCSDGTLYTGVALNVRERLAQHDAGLGARYTRGRGPLQLCATRRCVTKGAALRLELAVKRLDRPGKEQVIVGRRLAAFARRVAAKVSARTDGESRRAIPVQASPARP